MIPTPYHISYRGPVYCEGTASYTLSIERAALVGPMQTSLELSIFCDEISQAVFDEDRTKLYVLQPITFMMKEQNGAYEDVIVKFDAGIDSNDVSELLDILAERILSGERI